MTVLRCSALMLVVLALALAGCTSDGDSGTVRASGLVAVVQDGRLAVIDSAGDDASVEDGGLTESIPVWSFGGTSVAFVRDGALQWAPTNLQFTTRVVPVEAGSRFFWSPDDSRFLIDDGAGTAIVDKSGNHVWRMDGVTPLGFWQATGLVGLGVALTDGTDSRIVSTYNDETLWSFDGATIYPSPTDERVLVGRADGWSLWHPLTGETPIAGLSGGTMGAWDASGERFAIDAAGGTVIVDATTLATTPLGQDGALLGWSGNAITLQSDGAVTLVTPGGADARTIESATYAAAQPERAPVDATVSATSSLPAVAFEPVATLADSPITSAVPHPNGQILYLVDIAGRVIADQNGVQSTVLDIRDQVTLYNESGLLGMALHPDFPATPLAYIYYGFGGVTGAINLGPRVNTVASFEITADGLSAVPDTLQAGFRIEAPVQSPMEHNAGDLTFGPNGMLYVGAGDMGDFETADDPDTPNGNMFALDVSTSPWAATTVGYGFRNPFRFSVDPVTNQMWIGDVGGLNREEIDILKVGGNFGWPIREGELCRDTMTDCGAPGVDPVHSWFIYERGLACGGGVIGGYVYRGSAMPELYGWYIYGDLCSGEIKALDPAAPKNPIVVLGVAPTAPEFGSLTDVNPDADGEPLIIGLLAGVTRMVPAE